MAFKEEKFTKQLAVAKIKLEEILELSTSGYVEDISLANEQIGALISRLEKSKDGTIDYLIEIDKELEGCLQNEDLRPKTQKRRPKNED